MSAPNVYVLRTELLSGGRVVDFVEQQVGFRTVHFDPDRGLFLNGRPLKLHGVCEHHDFGSLGAAFNLCALRRKFLKLRNMGVNSFRTSHNPQAPAFLDLADRMGFLIDDEFFDMWEKSKTAYDYGNYFAEWHERDCAAQTRRDRNHPCLLMWSIGNEIYDTHQGNGLAITRGLKAIVRRHDPERNGLVTIGSNYMDGEGAQRCAEELDLVGYNYAERLYEAHHRGHPGWCVYGSETERAVAEFQRDNKIRITGIVNNATWRALQKAKKVKWGVDVPKPAAKESGTLASKGPLAPNNAPILAKGKVGALLKTARSYIGVPYAFGGTTPKAFDCSGYLQYVFAKNGINIPRTADEQYKLGLRTNSSKQLVPGDLVFFTTYEPGASHCGIYLGDGEFIHASSSKGVRVDALSDTYWAPRYLGGKHIVK